MEDFPAMGNIPSNHRTGRNVEMEDTISGELPVVTKVSLMRAPEDFIRKDSASSASHTIIEPTKEELEDLNSLQWNSQPIANPHVLLLLLHQKDLEIKGLKNAAREHPPDRLTCILQELVGTRQKAPLKKNQTEDILRKEIEQLNSKLKAAKESHMKEMQMLQEKLMRSQLCVLNLQDEAKHLSPILENESDIESSVSLDEGAQLACESFELWSETGNRLLTEKSDLKLRRIPKHTSFVDAFHKFGSIIFSDEDKDEKVISTTDSEVKEQRGVIPAQSSQESSKTKESQSDPSSWATVISQKSDLVSTVTDTRTESSSSLPSLMEKLQQGGSINTSHSGDYWNVVQSDFSPGQTAARKAPWMPVPFTGGYKRDPTIAGSLKIISVDRQGKFIRILNNLLNKEVDLSGYIIQQWVGGYPVSIYRFPNGTVLPAQYHITVWAAGANLAQKQPSDISLGSQRFFRAGPECTTILCNCSGQTVSQYTEPHRFTAAAEAYSDNVDLSVDKFPLTDDQEESLESSWPSKEEVVLPAKTLQKEMMDSSSRSLKTSLQRKTQFRTEAEEMETKLRSQCLGYTGPVSIDSSCSTDWNIHPRTTKRRISDASSPSSILSLSLKSNSHPLLMKERHSSLSQDESFTSQTWKPLPEEPKAREFKTTLDITLPMVAVIGQKSARSKYGFKYMSYVPTTTDLHLRRYYYGS